MNIEQIQPELAADDITRLLADDDATATAALTRLLHDWTGCDIPQTSDLPESEVEELVPLCVSILRRHWQTPLTCLGDGITPMSLADLLRQTIGDRVQGNEAWSIPPVHANIPAALTALRDRHIADGLTLTLSDGTTTKLPDGLSLAQLLCTTLADTITELKDDNKGWTMTKALTNLPNLEKVILRCKRWEESADRLNPMMSNLTKVKEVIADELEYIPDDALGNRTTASLLNGLTDCESVSFKSLKRARMVYPTGGGNARFFNNMPSLKVVHFDGMEYINVYRVDGFPVKLASADSLEEIYLGNLNKETQAINLDNQTHLGLIAIKGCEGSFNLSTWNPTTALAERLDEFLSNFKTYIAHRLTDKGSGLTLTLSPAVRDAIQQDPEIVSIITSKGWTISPAPSV